MEQQPGTREALARLLNTQLYSLPIYLRGAAPWTHEGDERLLATLAHIAANQQSLAARIAARLANHDRVVARGGFPIGFTALNDLALDFLLDRLIANQRETLSVIEDCALRLSDDPMGQSLAEEALGAARGHFDSLLEIAASRGSE